MKVGYNPALMGKSLADFVNEALTQVQEVTPSFVAERASKTNSMPVISPEPNCSREDFSKSEPT
ncbi:MAG: hypothetical protein ACOVQM_09360 [Pirellula sp.]